jgi:histidine triad (HIT) family protein
MPNAAVRVLRATPGDEAEVARFEAAFDHEVLPDQTRRYLAPNDPPVVGIRSGAREGPSIRSMAADCVFCAIVAGDAPSRLVMESSRAMALLDINPASDGHTLVIPRTHATDIWKLAGEDADEVWRLTLRVAHRLDEVLKPEGLTLFQANRRAGWQDVFHFHIHVVPRWRDDGLIKPWEMAQGDPSRLDKIAAQLAHASS